MCLPPFAYLAFSYMEERHPRMWGEEGRGQRPAYSIVKECLTMELKGKKNFNSQIKQKYVKSLKPSQTPTLSLMEKYNNHSGSKWNLYRRFFMTRHKTSILQKWKSLFCACGSINKALHRWTTEPCMCLDLQGWGAGLRFLHHLVPGSQLQPRLPRQPRNQKKSEEHLREKNLGLRLNFL